MAVPMADLIYVVQILSTGSHGYPYDEIAEIGISAVDPEAKTFKAVYRNTVFRDPKTLGKEKMDYLAENHRMTAEDLSGGEPEEKVSAEVLEIIRGRKVACYETKQVFGRYMAGAPWDITYKTSVMPSISAKMPISLRCKDPSEEPDIIRKAYGRLLKNDPAGVRRSRRAGDLALMSACLMIHMMEKGKY